MPTLSTAGVSLNYLSIGQGEDLVLLHGLGANLAFWFPVVVPLLARYYRVTVYDLRGHGRSSMPASGYRMQDMVGDLFGLLDALAARRVHLVGHSYGARVAVHAALQDPARLASLTVADTQLRCLQAPMRLREWAHWPAWREELVRQGYTEFPDDDAEISFRLLAAFAQLPGALEGAARPSLRRRDMGNRGAERWRRLMNETGAAQELDDEPASAAAIGGISLPTLLMFGERSHCLPTMEGLARLIRHSRVEIVPGVGHFFPALRPGTFCRRLRHFLGLGGGRRAGGATGTLMGSGR